MQGISRDGSEAGSKGDGFDKDAQKEVDGRSIYVGNVDYSVDSKSIAEFFSVRILHLSLCLPIRACLTVWVVTLS